MTQADTERAPVGSFYDPIAISYPRIGVRTKRAVHFNDRPLLRPIKGIRCGRVDVNPLRWRLWHHWPKCHWCGRVTVLEGKINTRGNPGNRRDTATIDHMKSRLMGRRPMELTPKVLACDHCNHTRAEMEEKLKKGYRIPLAWAMLFLSGLDGEGI